MSLTNNFPNTRPELLLDFANVGRLDPRITFTRASTATYFNQVGVLTTAQNDEARFDYDPSTLAARGLLIEEQRTNSIRNNTMQGAVAGTPGTAPTNWLIPTPSNGLARQIVGTGTESGITYVDVRYSGTTTGAGLTAIYWESATQVAASSGQTWTNSAYVALVGGSTANTNAVVIGIDENNGAGGFLVGSSTSFVPSAGALSGKRVSHTRTLTNASTAFVWSYVFFTYNSGVAIDITLRIGLPQLELGAFATSVIPTTTIALTRNADVASMTGTNFSSWYNASEGTLFTQSQRIGSTTAAGFPRVISANDNTSNNEIGVLWAQTISKLFGVCVTGGVTQCDLNYTGQTQTSNYKTAFAYKINDFAFSANAQAVQTDTGGTIPAVDRFTIGHIASSGLLNGWISKIAYYDTRLTNAQLQALTL